MGAWLPRAVVAASLVSVGSLQVPPAPRCAPWLPPVACCVRRRCPAVPLAFPVAVASVVLVCVLACLPSVLPVPAARARVAVPVLPAAAALVPRVVAAWWVPAVSPVLVVLVLPVAVALVLPAAAVPLAAVALVLPVAAALVLPVAVALVVVACWAGVLLPVVVRRRRRRSVVITMWYALTASRSSRRAWLAVPLAAPIS